MRPDAWQLQSLSPDVPPELIAEHVKRLGDDYFDRFELAEIARHLELLARLGPESSVEILLEPAERGFAHLTLLAWDWPALFSLLAGALFSVGFSIQSGDVFTYARSVQRRPRQATRSSPRRRGQRAVRRSSSPDTSNRLERRRIVDSFLVSFSPEHSIDELRRELDEMLRKLFRLLEEGRTESAHAARLLVNERVTERLARLDLSDDPVLLPVQIEVAAVGSRATRLTVIGQDTPAFLYSLSTALALQSLTIESVRIRTAEGQVRDEIELVHASGRAITDPDELNRLRLLAILTKQFTYFLDKAPDPYAALGRFENLLERFLELPRHDDTIAQLSDANLLGDLARILGASDYLWEDFIRSQYEEIVPVLKPGWDGRPQRFTIESFSSELGMDIARTTRFEERVEILNRHKDRGLFRIDLDHILDPSDGFRQLSESLSSMAQVVVQTAARIIYEDLAARHGRPRGAAGIEATSAVFGLGKLGGEALGYASDIELLVVYGDNGSTDGDDAITNAEFFSALARNIAKVIRAKRQGIFEVDLRLRPYGNQGPMATSLETFCTYYGPGGAAHSAERLALVRLRTLAGDSELGARVERLRDEYVFTRQSIDLEEIQELRARQFADRKETGRYNAKYSAGGLVDIEYTVQVLQVFWATQHPGLRTPRIHRALEALRDAEIVDDAECGRLVNAYDFFRELINGLRMLRGTAVDLYLPETGSPEYLHLARRMGYEPRKDLGADDQLHLDFETSTAAVRTFVKRHMGPESLPGPVGGNIVDLVLAESPREELVTRVLTALRFRRPQRALDALRALAGTGERRELFTRLAVLACDHLRHEPDPDMALGNWGALPRCVRRCGGTLPRTSLPAEAARYPARHSSRAASSSPTH